MQQEEFHQSKQSHPAGIYLLKVNNRNSRTGCEICSKLTSISIVNFEHVFAGWEGFLLLSEIQDFPGLTFKWLLNQQKSLDKEAVNSKATLGMSVAHEYGVASSA